MTKERDPAFSFANLDGGDSQGAVSDLIMKQRDETQGFTNDYRNLQE